MHPTAQRLQVGFSFSRRVCLSSHYAATVNSFAGDDKHPRDFSRPQHRTPPPSSSSQARGKRPSNDQPGCAVERGSTLGFFRMLQLQHSPRATEVLPPSSPTSLGFTVGGFACVGNVTAANSSPIFSRRLSSEYLLVQCDFPHIPVEMF